MKSIGSRIALLGCALFLGGCPEPATQNVMPSRVEYDSYGDYAAALPAGCPAALGYYFKAWDDNDAAVLDDHMIPAVTHRSTKSKGIGGITSGRHAQADNRGELKRRIGAAHRIFAGVPNTKGFNLVAVGPPQCDVGGAPTPGAMLHRQLIRIEGELQTRLASARPRMPTPEAQCGDETATSCDCNCEPGEPDSANWPAGPNHRDSWEIVVEVETNNANRIIAASLPY